MLICEEQKTPICYNGMTFDIPEPFLNAYFFLNNAPLENLFVKEIVERYDVHTPEQIIFTAKYLIRDEFICIYGEGAWKALCDNVIEKNDKILECSNKGFCILKPNGSSVNVLLEPSVPLNGKCECLHCMDVTEYELKFKIKEKTVDGNKAYKIKIPTARCKKCGNEAYVPGIDTMVQKNTVNNRLGRVFLLRKGSFFIPFCDFSDFLP